MAPDGAVLADLVVDDDHRGGGSVQDAGRDAEGAGHFEVFPRPVSGECAAYQWDSVRPRTGRKGLIRATFSA